MSGLSHSYPATNVEAAPDTSTAVEVPPEADTAADFGRILERVSDAFVALDRNWRYTYLNPQAGLLFGRPPATLVGKHIWTEFPEGVGQPFHRAYERAMAEQVSIQMENFYEPWNRWFENRIYPSADGVSIFFHEITARKQAEQAAHQSAELVQGQHRVLELISQGAPLGKTLDTLLTLTEAQCPGMICSILLLEPDGITMRHASGPSLPESFIRAIDHQPIGPRAGSCGTAAFRRQAVIVEDIASDPLWADYREVALQHDLGACWSTPIFDGQDGVLGTFALYFRSPGVPTQRHRELIAVSTHTASIAVVTHRKAEALRTSEERLRLAVTSGNVGIWEWDLRTDRLLWSHELKSIFGWSLTLEELTMEMFRNAIHSEDRLVVEAALRRALADRANYEVEFRILRPDHSVHWVEAKGHGEYDADGRPSRMLGIALEITERKRGADELNTRGAQLAEAQRIAQLGSYEWDIPTNAVSRSDELCRIFGLDTAQFQPTFEAYLERVHPSDRDATQAIIERALRDRVPFDFEERIVRADGTIRRLRSQGRWVFGAAEQPVKLLGICQDVTDQKHAEQLQQRSLELEAEIKHRQQAEALLSAKNEELKGFAYTVSHDLKAPLRGIAGYAQELERRHRAGLPDRALFCLKQIVTATHSLDRLIEDLLHYARLDAETPTDSDVNVAEIVEAILLDRRDVILEQAAEVTVRLAATTIRTWKRGLVQVLTNLIDNALEVQPAREPVLDHRLERRAGRAFVVAVADNGIGFDMKYHDRIFGLFNRLVRDDEFEGTGAGLAIVKKFVEKLGGTIRADSQPGRGAIFRVELPRGAATGSGAAA